MSSYLAELRRRATEESRAARESQSLLDRLVHENKERSFRRRIRDEEFLTGEAVSCRFLDME
jgi:hypothetical protein